MSYTVKRALDEFVDCFPTDTIPSEFFDPHTEFRDKLIDYVYELRNFEQEELYLQTLSRVGDKYEIPALLLSKFNELFTYEEWSSVKLIISQYWDDLCIQQEEGLQKVTVGMMRKLIYMVENLYELTGN